MRLFLLSPDTFNAFRIPEICLFSKCPTKNDNNKGYLQRGTHAVIVPDAIVAVRARTAARYVGAPVVVAVGLRGAAVRSVCLTHEAERHQASQGGGGIATKSPARPPWPAATPATCLAPANDGY